MKCALIGLLLAGCAAHTAKVAVPQVVVPRDCILSVALTPKTQCVGADGKPLNCVGLKLVKIRGCEQVKVK